MVIKLLQREYIANHLEIIEINILFRYLWSNKT